MLAASISALMALFSVKSLVFMFIGVLFGLLIGFLPGLGGVIALCLLMPFIYGMDFAPAIALLWGAHVAVVFGGSISAILFNVPGTSKSIATCFDGFPMTQKGEAARALAASATSSLIGGIFGAIVLTFSVPLMRAIVLALGGPEYFMMALLGLVVIALFTSGSVFKGIVAAGLGLLVSFIGLDPVTGTPRYTFGSLFLWDGIDFAAAVIGLFAISQMIDLYVKGGAIATKRATGATGSVLQGIKDTFRHWFLLLRSSVLGVVIGALPGVGGTVGNIMAYGQAVQTSRTPEKFGTGTVEGVIAPEAAVAANEGGGLIPTLGFGIPGGEGPAILLAAFIILGVAPGPDMLTKHLDTVFMMVWVLVIANVMATGIGLISAKWLAKISTLPGNVLIPLVLIVCAVGAFAINGRIGDMLVAVIFGVIGYVMKKYDYSRADMVIGMVMGTLVERYFHISMRLYGPTSFFTRPIALVLFLLCLFTIIYPIIRARSRKHSGGVAI